MKSTNDLVLSLFSNTHLFDHKASSSKIQNLLESDMVQQSIGHDEILIAGSEDTLKSILSDLVKFTPVTLVIE